MNHDSAANHKNLANLENLAENCNKSILDRRAYEWKVNFGIWSGVGIVTWFLTQPPAPGEFAVWSILVGYFVLWFLYTV